MGQNSRMPGFFRGVACFTSVSVPVITLKVGKVHHWSDTQKKWPNCQLLHLPKNGLLKIGTSAHFLFHTKSSFSQNFHRLRKTKETLVVLEAISFCNFM